MSWSEVQQGPAFGFTVVALMVVFGPLIAAQLRMPGLLGLLLGGALIGPNMLDVLPSFDTLNSVGTIGVLYLIFLAGLQLDIDAFLRFRRISVGFGLLTAFVPLALGTIIALVLDIDAAAALLVGSFWASFTLITYPTVSNYGLTKNRAVAAIVGASSITDTISLIILALVIGSETGDASGPRLVFDIAAGLVVLAVWCLAIYPKLARAFFTGLGQERTLRYAMVLIGLTSAAVVAELVGIEALIGAFFMGVGLNRQVPNASTLMAVTDFFGNAFFIPTFLISVGLLFDPEVMFTADTLRLAAGFIGALVIGKAIAAWVSGRIFDLSRAETGLMFSMSVAQAAATLAATIIGLEAGLYGDDVVNAVMVVVAASLVITSIGTDRFAPQVPVPVGEVRRPGEAILVPTLDVPDEMLTGMAVVAGRLAEDAGGLVQPIVVATSTSPDDHRHARDEVISADTIHRRAGQDVDTEFRIDRSVAFGLQRSALQDDSTLLILPWTTGDLTRSRLLGARYSEIVAATSLPVMITALHPNLDLKKATVALVAHDVSVGGRPSLQLGADVGSALADRERPLIVGPTAKDALTHIDLDLPEHMLYRTGDDVVEWVEAHTQVGDIVVTPFVGITIRSAARKIHDLGRNVLAVAANPTAQPTRGASTMSIPPGGTINSA